MLKFINLKVLKMEKDSEDWCKDNGYRAILDVDIKKQKFFEEEQA